jgi:hypothetical protein
VARDEVERTLSTDGEFTFSVRLIGQSSLEVTTMRRQIPALLAVALLALSVKPVRPQGVPNLLLEKGLELALDRVVGWLEAIESSPIGDRLLGGGFCDRGGTVGRTGG